MPVTFVIGRAGSGKTHRCLARMVEQAKAQPLGPPIFWIVPRQATFQAERELACELKAFSRVRVVSFNMLGRQIAEDCGETAVPDVTDLGRQMILGHLLRRHQPKLSFFASVARRPGLAAELHETFAEFERSGKTIDDLRDLLDHLRHADPADAQGPSLQAKLRDLLLLYAEYSRYLGQDRLDQHQRLTQVLQKIEHCELVRGATVYVDAFLDFTDYERRVLAGLGKVCSSVEICLMFDPASATLRDPHHVPDELGLFHRTEEAYRKLWFAFAGEDVKVTDPVILEQSHRFAPTKLRRIERGLFSGAITSADAGVGSDNVTSPNVPSRGAAVKEDAASIEGASSPAAKRRQNKAHGVSRGSAAADNTSPGGAKESSAPPGLASNSNNNAVVDAIPTAHAVGFNLVAPPGLSDLASTRPESQDRDPHAVQLIEAPDPAAEVDAAARAIRSLLQQGMRLRDIAVLARNLDPYQDLIDRSFGEHDIAYFADRRRTASHHPLLQFVRSALQMARGQWAHPTVMGFLKSGLAGVSLDDADELEGYILAHRLHNRPWDDVQPWGFEREPDEEIASLPAAEAFEVRDVESLRRKMVASLEPLLAQFRGNRPVAVRAAAGAMFETFERFDVRAMLSKWSTEATADGDLEQAGEHGQVWTKLVDLFEQMVDLLGDEQVKPGEFVDVLESGLEQFDLALAPPTVDQVLVGPIDRTRTPALRATIVLGLTEGQFPAIARDAAILSRSERRELNRLKMNLDRDPQRRQLDERLLAYLAFTRAAERLIVTRPLADDGGTPVGPSPYWHELRRLLPEVLPERIERDRGREVRHIGTPRQLVTALMAWAREERPAVADKPTRGQGDLGTRRQGDTETGGQGDPQAPSSSPLLSLSPNLPVSVSPCPSTSGQSSPGDTDPRPALYQWLTAYPCTGDRLDQTRYHAWTALGYRNEPTLSPGLAAALFPTPLRATAAQLETFAACPFQHFLKFGVRLSGRAAVSFTAMDMSQVYHDVLEILIGELFEGSRQWKDVSAEEARKLIGTYATAVAQRLRGEVRLEGARSQYILGRIERTLEQVFESVRAMLSRGRFRPAQAGVRFGDGGRLPHLTVNTPRGADAMLSGRIDRIDRLDDAENTAAATVVYDYKLSSGRLSLPNLFHGLSLQLITYLLVLESSGQQLTGRAMTPAAAFAYQLLRKMGPVDHPDEAIGPDDPAFALNPKPRGVLNGRFFPSLDRNAEPGEWSDVVQVQLKKDGDFGSRNSSDVADASEFAALLGFVRLRIGELADDVMSGRVSVTPYRMGRTTPCPRCEFRSVCRFEPTVAGYRQLEPMRRLEALERMTGRPAHAE